MLIASSCFSVCAWGGCMHMCANVCICHSMMHILYNQKSITMHSSLQQAVCSVIYVESSANGAPCIGGR